MGKFAIAKEDVSVLIKAGDRMDLKGKYYVKKGYFSRRNVRVRVPQEDGSVKVFTPPNFYHKEIVESSRFFTVHRS